MSSLADIAKTLVAHQQALLHRARCNQAARFGRYDETLEQSV